MTIVEPSPGFPPVSIVIVSWNAVEFLARCLQSLATRAYAGPIETIVVDNASADGSAEMVLRDFSDVRLIRNADNLGFARASNIGIRHCTGEYIALINSDVHVLPDCITALVTFLQARPAAGLIGPAVIDGDGKRQLSCRGAPSLWNTLCRALALDVAFPASRWSNGYLLRHAEHRDAVPVDILSGCFWLTHRRALADVDLLDESFFIYGEDMDWCKRFRDAGWQVVFVPQARAIHYGGASSANSPVRFFIEKQKADIQYWRKHHSSIAARFYIAISLLHHGLRIGGYSLRSAVTARNAGGDRYKIRRSWACMRWMVLKKDDLR